jgi:hypothetical protein
MSEQQNTKTTASNTCVKLKTPSVKYSAPSYSMTDRIASGNVDKRVALTVAPKTYLRDESIFANKVVKVLGREYYKGGTDISWLMSGVNFYGLVRNALGSTSGLIFPYTPKVSFSHNVNYQSQEITHTNITHHYYQNTASPSISLDAKFTADNRSNALHMLSAMWYLIACSKCDFGLSTSTPGLPPPILYLSGYDTTIDNIPVLIKSINYNYPDELHYVNLVLDMTMQYDGNEDLPFVYNNEMYGNGSKFLQEYERQTTMDRYGWGKEINLVNFDINHTPAKKLKNGIIDGPGVVSSYLKTTREGYINKLTPISREGGVKLSFWLPTELSISLQLLVQPNVLKEQKQWSLDGFKSGLLMTNVGKNPSVVENTTSETKKVIKDINGQCVETEIEVAKNEFYKFIPHGWTW